MLVLTRKIQQQIQIGDRITVTVMRVKGQSVRIGIEAPDDVRIMRSELPDAREPAQMQVPSDAEESGAMPPHDAPALPVAPGTSPLGAAVAQACRSPLTTSCRTSGASRAPLIRRAQRLGPGSLRSFAGRM
jgi:carbon storage regulator CsrA